MGCLALNYLLVLLMKIQFQVMAAFKPTLICNKTKSLDMINHYQQQRLDLECEMEMMSMWREQISNVITV